MIKLQYQGHEAVMNIEELIQLLDESGLPWYVGWDEFKPEISIIGQEQDLVINGEFTW